MNNNYVRHMPWNWFVKRPAYVRFMARELTAIAVGVYLIEFLLILHRLSLGEAAFVATLDQLTHPLAIAANAALLLGAAWHSITWFNLTPKAMPVFLGAKRVADAPVAIAMGYIPWIAVTVLVLWGVCP
ncbi:MAG: fumarate reductase subunit C [Planctomycetota bacterium]|jgi:fumarate reductase subunit C